MRITLAGCGGRCNPAAVPAAIDRTLAVLRDYRTAMDDLGVVRRRVRATSAARDAANAEEFMAALPRSPGCVLTYSRARKRAGCPLRGRLLACLRNEPGRGLSPVADIGGGSTELGGGVCTRLGRHAGTRGEDPVARHRVREERASGCCPTTRRGPSSWPGHATKCGSSSSRPGATSPRWRRSVSSSAWPERCPRWPRWEGAIAWKRSTGAHPSRRAGVHRRGALVAHPVG